MSQHGGQRSTETASRKINNTSGLEVGESCAFSPLQNLLKAFLFQKPLNTDPVQIDSSMFWGTFRTQIQVNPARKCALKINSMKDLVYKGMIILHWIDAKKMKLEKLLTLYTRITSK